MNNKNYSFKEYLHAVRGNKLSVVYKYHSLPQSSRSDIYINKIVKVEDIESQLKIIDEQQGFKLYQSYLVIKSKKLTHITPKNKEIIHFVGYMKADELKQIGIPDYKYFYNEDIRRLVEQIYMNDIRNYKYSYPF